MNETLVLLIILTIGMVLTSCLAFCQFMINNKQAEINASLMRYIDHLEDLVHCCWNEDDRMDDVSD